MVAKQSQRSLAVIGLGYVGLPLAVQAAQKGYSVTGLEISQPLIELVNARTSPYANDPRFEKALKKTSKKFLAATSDFKILKQVSTVVICVPTPTEHNIPDFSFVKNAAKQIAEHLQKGQLVILESTVSPGVTRDIVLPILQKASGMVVGKDFYLAHCPERIDPGNEKYFVGNLNRVVGGITPKCTEKAAAFYSSIIDAKIIPLGSTEEAEFVKSWENTQRNVMIALANSAAIICDGLDMDIERVLEGLQSKVDQFGLKLAQPGIGPGGHCIPEDIHYVIKRARASGIDTRFLDDAAELNDKMPQYAVHRLRTMVSKNGEKLKDMRVALLGLTYKPDISDIRRSPAIETAYVLERYAASVTAYDPYVLPKNFAHNTHVSSSLASALKGADAIFIATAHKQFQQELTVKLLKKHHIRYVLDGRNILDKAALEKAGIHYRGIGR
ncbi:MAG: nucleotide sugar dehydrogenase [Candidatus Saccharimonadales bacterium]